MVKIGFVYEVEESFHILGGKNAEYREKLGCIYGRNISIGCGS
jgi:hypothetical protein